MALTIASGSREDFDDVLAISRQAGRALALGRELTVEELEVDSDNGTGAPRLDERVGMRVDRRYPIYSKAL